MWAGKECLKEYLLLPVPGIVGEHCRKTGEKMQAHARDPLGVTREAVDADERQTGFHSRGKIMVEHTVRVIVPYQGVIQPPWRPAGSGPAGRYPGENPGQCLDHDVAFFRTCAYMADTLQAEVS